jgi:DNA-binding MltR family transcriptional regulator
MRVSADAARLLGGKRSHFVKDEIMSDPRSCQERNTKVEQIAKALFEHAVRSGRDDVSSRELPLDQIVKVFDAALMASDREAAIIIFALVDDLATEFFREKLTGRVHNGVDEVFLSGNGMLATAYNKIVLLAGLQWISDVIYRQLTLMRKIRNDFAHNVNLTAFTDNPIRDYIESMEAAEREILGAIPPSKTPVGMSARIKFIIRSVLTICIFVQDLTVIQAANHHRVSPDAILAGGFNNLPENIKDLLRTGARIALRALEVDPSNE